ncbi:hypothetical protein N8J89_03715 [Crossiella sp. CA-258035]|uniref:hypothetical protein n=1 Tax=Crossiella sp. CA-258035 TaxID=2981138 RepID=UPI0024BC1763|nr:hypothetical protein [Crossiella sp. CA-258035]WHT20191.1 hypothetical protein N8J89_03715 [Crossiella sp. CA-258035]
MGKLVCSLWDSETWSTCLDTLLTDLFRDMAIGALNPLLELLGSTLLATPTPASLPRIGELWQASWEIVLACYGLIVIFAGLQLMAYQSVQTRASAQEILPRLFTGFLASALSLFVAVKAIDLANALSAAVMGEGVNPAQAADALKQLLLGPSIVMSIVNALLLVAVAIGVVVLVLTYLVRVALTVILIAAAPLLLMGHALSISEGIARWWWKAFGGCLAVQLAQSMTLITALRVVLAPGFTPFGPSTGGLINLLVALALLYILCKIPFWILGPLRLSQGRSLVGGVLRAYVMGKAFGLLGNRRSRPAPSARPHPAPAGPRARSGSEPPWPMAIREWGGLAGIGGPEAIARRLREHHAAELARKQPPSRVTAVRFQQHTPQRPTHDLAPRHASEAPAMTEFRTPTPDPPTAAVPISRRPGTVPHPAFRTAAAPIPAPVRVPVAAVPAHLRFQAATAEPTIPPRVAGSAPASPVFQAPVGEPVGRRARSHTPAPPQFRPPTPPAPAPPVSPERGAAAAPPVLFQPPRPQRPTRPGGSS